MIIMIMIIIFVMMMVLVLEEVMMWEQGKVRVPE